MIKDYVIINSIIIYIILANIALLLALVNVKQIVSILDKRRDQQRSDEASEKLAAIVNKLNSEETE